MSEPLAISLLSSTLITASGQTAALAVTGRQRVAQVKINSSVLVGTGNLQLSFQRRDSTAEEWETVETFGVVSARSEEIGIKIGPLNRIDYELEGLTSVTVSVSGTAHTVYAEPTDLTRLSVKPDALNEMTLAQLVDACIAASAEADGYLGGAFKLPITAWDTDLRLKTAQLAVANLFMLRGAEPDGPDALVFDARNKALQWFDKILAGRLRPPGIIDTAPEVFEAGAYVASRPPRGYDDW